MQNLNSGGSMKLDHLRQFIIIAEEGTLTKAAEQLSISQSTLTRNMYNLENILKVSLFKHGANQIELTETGEYALSQFEKLIHYNEYVINNIRDFENKKFVIRGEVCAQGPTFKINKLKNENQISVEVKLKKETDLVLDLKEDNTDFIVTTYQITDDTIESHYFFHEQMYLSVPKEHPLYERECVSLSELSGQTLLLRTGLGVWQELIDSLTNINFVVQERKAFDQLISRFSLPAFTTNISQQYNLGDERKNILITDDIASKDYYLSFYPRYKDKLLFLLDNGKSEMEA